MVSEDESYFSSIEWYLKPVHKNSGDEDDFNGVILFNQPEARGGDYMKLGKDVMTYDFFDDVTNNVVD